MEDGLAVAIALHRAKGDVPLGLRVFERIRFNRSHVVHMSSISVRDGYHTVDTNVDEVEKNPEIVNLPRFEWVIEHDAEANAEKYFDQLARDVKSYRPGAIEELSLPAEGDFSVEKRVKRENAPIQAKLQTNCRNWYNKLSSSV